jgi:hypothetical protein
MKRCIEIGTTLVQLAYKLVVQGLSSYGSIRKYFVSIKVVFVILPEDRWYVLLLSCFLRFFVV